MHWKTKLADRQWVFEVLTRTDPPRFVALFKHSEDAYAFAGMAGTLDFHVKPWPRPREPGDTTLRDRIDKEAPQEVPKHCCWCENGECVVQYGGQHEKQSCLKHNATMSMAALYG